MCVCVHVYMCAPGWMGWFPGWSRSLRVNPAGMYLGLCQNQKRLRLMTSASGMSLSESINRRTGRSEPSGSISDSRLVVAFANITSFGSLSLGSVSVCV